MAEKSKRRKLIIRVLMACGIGLLISGTIWGVIAFPELKKRYGLFEKTPEEIEAEQKLKAEESEKSADWRNYHCNLLYKYYDETAKDVPLNELVGLPASADDQDFKRRCRVLYDTVRMMGGFPTSQPAVDNFIVCDGFDLVLWGPTFEIIVRPTREDLKNNVVRYGYEGQGFTTQKMINGQPMNLGSFITRVMQVDDQCVVASMERLGRARRIPGKLVRRTEAKPE